MKQLHKKFNNYQVKDLIARYLKKKVEREEIQKVLDIKKTRFFTLLKRLKDDPENFSVSYFRSIPTRTISKDIETNIIKELNTEKDLIQAKEVPIRWYNYSNNAFIDRRLKRKIKILDIFVSRKFGSSIPFLVAVSPPVVLFVL